MDYVRSSRALYIMYIPSERKDVHLVPTVSSIRGQIVVAHDSAPVPFESALERMFLQVCHSENQVVRVEAQPFTLQFHDLIAGSKRKYTPDFLVHFDKSRKRTWGPSFDKPCLVEVKPRRMLWRNRRKLIPKFHAAQQWCMKNDMSFHVVTEDWLSSVIVKNAELLSSALIVGEDKECETAVKEFLDGTFGAQVFDLLHEMDASGFDRGSVVRALYRCIAKGEVDTLLFRPLNQKSMLDYIYGKSPIIPFV